MAKYVLKDAFVRIDDVDLSEFASEVSIETSRDEVDVSGQGGDFKEIIAGLGDATITVTFWQDHAATSVDETLWPLSTTDTPFEVYIKPTSAAVGAGNPAFVMTSLMYSYSPVAGGTGAASSTPVTFRNASQTGLVRSITAT